MSKVAEIQHSKQLYFMLFSTLDVKIVIVDNS